MSGRLKELLITSGGENIAPLQIENNISAELNEVLSYVVVVGDGRKYLTSLLTLKCKPESNILDEEAMKWAQSREVIKNAKHESYLKKTATSRLRIADLTTSNLRVLSIYQYLRNLRILRFFFINFLDFCIVY